MAIFFAGGRGRSPWSKLCANLSLFFSRSSVVLIRFLLGSGPCPRYPTLGIVAAMLFSYFGACWTRAPPHSRKEEVHERKQGTVGEGRLHADRAEHAKERRGARQKARNHRRSQGLDLGSGDGTTAVPEAQLGADVLGVDIAGNLVAAGNERAKALGLANLSFEEGDATDLKELDDGQFDLVVSIFGAMFAPKPFDVAKE